MSYTTEVVTQPGPYFFTHRVEIHIFLNKRKYIIRLEIPFLNQEMIVYINIEKHLDTCDRISLRL